MRRVISMLYSTVPLLLFLQVVFVIADSLTPFANRYVNSAILDKLIESVSTSSSITPALLNLIIIYAALSLFSSLVNRSSNIVETNIREKFRFSLEKTVTSKLARLDTEYYEDPQLNDLLQRVKRSFHRPIQFYMNLVDVFYHFVGIAASFLILYRLDPFLILLMSASVLPQAINNAVYGRKSWNLLRDKSEDLRDFHRTKGKLVAESSLKELRVFKLRPYFLERAFDSYHKFFTESLRMRNKRSYINLILSLISSLGYAFVYYVLITKVFSGAITVGLLTFYISTTNSFARAVSRIFTSVTGLYETGLYVADIYEVLDLPQKIISGTKKLDSKKTPPKIEFKNVSFRYPGTRKYILKDFNLIIEPGEHIAFVGENGAGKTTLIKLLMRFYDVDKGEILINGVLLNDLDLPDYYSRVATLFQDYNFYHFTAYDNIGVGNVTNIKDKKKVVSSAKRAGAHDFIQKYDNKYSQVLSKSFSGGIDPSTGQKQKIALARSFFKDAPMLIMDEPTSAIDPKAEYEIFQELFKFAEEKTVIIVSHRFSTVRNADRILVLEDGNIIEHGTHKDLMKIKNGVYRHAFDLQKKGYE